MKIIEVITSVLLFSVGTCLVFIGAFTAVALIGIPILLIGQKMQDASQLI